MRRGEFDAAILRFQQSLEWFERHPWIDNRRSIVLMSCSAMSYREMALVNIAFCHSQRGDGQNARFYYEKCLERFPQNGLAIAALRLMDAAREAR